MGGVFVGGDLIQSNLFCAVSHTVRIEKEREMTRKLPLPYNGRNGITNISFKIEKKGHTKIHYLYPIFRRKRNHINLLYIINERSVLG